MLLRRRGGKEKEKEKEKENENEREKRRKEERKLHFCRRHEKYICGGF